MDQRRARARGAASDGPSAPADQTWTPGGPTSPTEPRPTPGPTDQRASAEPESDVRYEGAGVMAGVIALLVVATLVVIVVAQNVDRVTFELLWWEARVPLAVLMLITALITLALDQLVGLVWRRRRRRYRELSRARR